MLFNSNSSITREVGSGEQFVSGVTLPRGFIVQCPIWTLHRDETVFDNPLTFEPERQHPPALSSIAYQPFGAGPRHCMGKAMAQTLVRHALRAIVTSFRLTACEQTDAPMLNVKFYKGFTDPLNGVWLNVRKL